MWKAIVHGIEVPGCEVDLSNKGKITLLVALDFPKLNELKGSSLNENSTFPVSVETELVSLSFKACWLISFEINGQIGPYDPEIERRAVRLIFGFKAE